MDSTIVKVVKTDLQHLPFFLRTMWQGHRQQTEVSDVPEIRPLNRTLWCSSPDFILAPFHSSVTYRQGSFLRWSRYPGELNLLKGVILYVDCCHDEDRSGPMLAAHGCPLRVNCIIHCTNNLLVTIWKLISQG